MTISKIGAFAIGVATVAIVKSAGFKKVCAGVVGAGMKLKDEEISTALTNELLQLKSLCDRYNGKDKSAILGKIADLRDKLS